MLFKTKKMKKLNKSKKIKKKQLKGGTIQSRGGVLVGVNSTGRADLAILNFLMLCVPRFKYIGNENTDRINLLEFYDRPDRRTSDFNMSVRELLDYMSREQVQEFLRLLRQSHAIRTRDAEVNRGRGNPPLEGHAHVAAIVRWLGDRIEEYITPHYDDEGRPINIIRNINEDRTFIRPYQNEFMNLYELIPAPPVPKLSTL